MRSTTGFVALGLLLATSTGSQLGHPAPCGRPFQASALATGQAGALCSQPLAMTLARPAARVHHT